MKAAIYGYGNIGRGTELALKAAADFETVGIFSRRNPQTIHSLTGVPVYAADSITEFKDIDVVIICGGSATDLPVLSPMLAEKFNIVDSFDTHAKIPRHFDAVNSAAETNKHTAVISGGWDPGLFSLARLLCDSIIPTGSYYTFWGTGVSQGHSDAIRRIEGVKDARQYTVPIENALKRIRAGETPELTAGEKHRRVCYVVAEDGADQAEIERKIKTMPDYFAPYNTEVHFISEEELKRDHSGMPHGGSVIFSGTTGLDSDPHVNTVEFSVKLASNPEFTSSVLVALARAAVRMNAKGEYGCKTVFDIPLALLSPKSEEEIRKTIL